MFRKEIKVTDCTLRDGGLINKWQFSHEMVRKVFLAVNQSGVDYMELGYRASRKMFDPKEYGPWRFTTDEDVREIIADTPVNMKLGVMVDIGRVEEEDIAPCEESPLDFIRVATYIHDIDKAIALANHVDAKGYESFINIMAISTAGEFELREALNQIEAETNVVAVNIVDSFGFLYSESVHYLVKLFLEKLKTKSTGFHAHNNQQLGFANTIEAIRKGANYLDGTITGIGRGAGNCPLELLLSFLRNPKFNIEPVLQVIEDVFLDLRQKIEWGYLIPYMITGILNEHPRTAIALRQDPQKKDKYAEFYRTMTTPECFSEK
ncbi:MAG: aldolase catalytic domain-containing protein [Victivallaceae bacterium]|nr:aldolase catalytic domain-containing protein [Victivallaceae bacterium]